MAELPLAAMTRIEQLMDTLYHKSKTAVDLLMELNPPSDIADEASEYIVRLEELHGEFLETPNEATARALVDHAMSWRSRDTLARFVANL